MRKANKRTLKVTYSKSVGSGVVVFVCTVYLAGSQIREIQSSLENIQQTAPRHLSFIHRRTNKNPRETRKQHIPKERKDRRIAGVKSNPKTNTCTRYNFFFVFCVVRARSVCVSLRHCFFFWPVHACILRETRVHTQL